MPDKCIPILKIQARVKASFIADCGDKLATGYTPSGGAGDVAGIIYGAGISWADLAPKHFFIPSADDPAELPGVLDLARMRPTSRPLKRYLPGELRRFCSRLRGRGGTDADEAAFIGALNARLERSADTANRGS